MKKRTPIQENVVALRKALGLTQQDLAVRMGRAINTVARWETSREPAGISLLQLRDFALTSGLPEIAAGFKSPLSFYEERERRRIDAKEVGGPFADLVDKYQKAGYELAIYRKAK